MQGKSLAPVIKEDKPIRDYALFGIHGAHVNITDGEYVYMKAPMNQENGPLYEYTLMPAHMRCLFTVEEMRNTVLSKPFKFTKECPVMKILKQSNFGNADFSLLLTDDKNKQRRIDNNDLLNAANFGDKLFDIKNDPNEEEELINVVIETRMANLMVRAMQENEAPPEQYERIGLPKDRQVTENDIRQIHEMRKKEHFCQILPDYNWERSAVNTYKALLMFIPEASREKVSQKIASELTTMAGKPGEKDITYSMIDATVSLVIPEQYKDMVSYFIGLAGRVA
jgi:hypothetical protein